MQQHHNHPLNRSDERNQAGTSSGLAEESPDESILERSKPTRQTDPLVCPTCKFPLQETAHGWVRDYSEHRDHAGHLVNKVKSARFFG
jgi:hypothetical protein